MTVKIESDQKADMGYLKLTNEEIKKTVCYGDVNLDLDSDGYVVGIEFFQFSRISSLFNIPEDKKD